MLRDSKNMCNSSLVCFVASVCKGYSCKRNINTERTSSAQHESCCGFVRSTNTHKQVSKNGHSQCQGVCIWQLEFQKVRRQQPLKCLPPALIGMATRLIQMQSMRRRQSRSASKWQNAMWLWPRTPAKTFCAENESIWEFFAVCLH